MGYEEFEARLLEALREVYGQDMAVLGERLKCNGVKEKCVYVCPGEGSGIALAVSLGELYGEFKSSIMGMEACLARIRELQRQLGGCPPDAWQSFGKVQDWELVKREVYPILLPTEGNGELLGWLASEGLMDLSVAYIIWLGVTGEGGSYIKVSKELLDQYGVSMEQLHKQAMQNLKEDGYAFRELSGLMEGIFLGDGDMAKPVASFKEGGMYVLQNASGLYGAAGMLDRELLHSVIGYRDCFIFPSSVHELIFFVPSDMGKVGQEELDALVREVNATQVPREERLADHSYYYDGQTGEVRIHI